MQTDCYLSYAIAQARIALIVFWIIDHICTLYNAAHGKLFYKVLFLPKIDTIIFTLQKKNYSVPIVIFPTKVNVNVDVDVDVDVDVIDDVALEDILGK